MSHPSTGLDAPGHPATQPADTRGASCPPPASDGTGLPTRLDVPSAAQNRYEITRAAWAGRRMDLGYLGAFLGILVLALGLAGCGIAPDAYCKTAVNAIIRAEETTMEVFGELHTAKKISDDTAWRLVAAHDVYVPIGKAAKVGCEAVTTQAAADAEIKKLQVAADVVLKAPR